MSSPGPSSGVGNLTFEPYELSNDSTEASCVSCGMPPDTLMLRSRPISNTVVRCTEKSCKKFTHEECRNKKEQLSDWKCPHHLSMVVDRIQQPNAVSADTDNNPQLQSPFDSDGLSGASTHHPSPPVPKNCPGSRPDHPTSRQHLLPRTPPDLRHTSDKHLLLRRVTDLGLGHFICHH